MSGGREFFSGVYRNQGSGTPAHTFEVVYRTQAKRDLSLERTSQIYSSILNQALSKQSSLAQADKLSIEISEQSQRVWISAKRQATLRLSFRELGLMLNDREGLQRITSPSSQAQAPRQIEITEFMRSLGKNMPTSSGWHRLVYVRDLISDTWATLSVKTTILSILYSVVKHGLWLEVVGTWERLTHVTLFTVNLLAYVFLKVYHTLKMPFPQFKRDFALYLFNRRIAPVSLEEALQTMIFFMREKAAESEDFKVLAEEYQACLRTLAEIEQYKTWTMPYQIEGLQRISQKLSAQIKALPAHKRTLLPGGFFKDNLFVPMLYEIERLNDQQCKFTIIDPHATLRHYQPTQQIDGLDFAKPFIEITLDVERVADPMGFIQPLLEMQFTGAASEVDLQGVAQRLAELATSRQVGGELATTFDQAAQGVIDHPITNRMNQYALRNFLSALKTSSGNIGRLVTAMIYGVGASGETVALERIIPEILKLAETPQAPPSAPADLKEVASPAAAQRVSNEQLMAVAKRGGSDFKVAWALLHRHHPTKARQLELELKYVTLHQLIQNELPHLKTQYGDTERRFIADCIRELSEEVEQYLKAKLGDPSKPKAHPSDADKDKELLHGIEIESMTARLAELQNILDEIERTLQRRLHNVTMPQNLPATHLGAARNEALTTLSAYQPTATPAALPMVQNQVIDWQASPQAALAQFTAAVEQIKQAKASVHPHKWRVLDAAATDLLRQLPLHVVTRTALPLPPEPPLTTANQQKLDYFERWLRNQLGSTPGLTEAKLRLSVNDRRLILLAEQGYDPIAPQYTNTIQTPWSRLAPTSDLQTQWSEQIHQLQEFMVQANHMQFSDGITGAHAEAFASGLAVTAYLAQENRQANLLEKRIGLDVSYLSAIKENLYFYSSNRAQQDRLRQAIDYLEKVHSPQQKGVFPISQLNLPIAAARDTWKFLPAMATLHHPNVDDAFAYAKRVFDRIGNTATHKASCTTLKEKLRELLLALPRQLAEHKNTFVLLVQHLPPINAHQMAKVQNFIKDLPPDLKLLAPNHAQTREVQNAIDALKEATKHFRHIELTDIGNMFDRGISGHLFARQEHDEHCMQMEILGDLGERGYNHPQVTHLRLASIYGIALFSNRHVYHGRGLIGVIQEIIAMGKGVLTGQVSFKNWRKDLERARADFVRSAMSTSQEVHFRYARESGVSAAMDKFWNMDFLLYEYGFILCYIAYVLMTSAAAGDWKRIIYIFVSFIASAPMLADLFARLLLKALYSLIFRHGTRGAEITAQPYNLAFESMIPNGLYGLGGYAGAKGPHHDFEKNDRYHLGIGAPLGGPNNNRNYVWDYCEKVIEFLIGENDEEEIRNKRNSRTEQHTLFEAHENHARIADLSLEESTDLQRTGLTNASIDETLIFFTKHSNLLERPEFQHLFEIKLLGWNKLNTRWWQNKELVVNLNRFFMQQIARAEATRRIPTLLFLLRFSQQVWSHFDAALVSTKLREGGQESVAHRLVIAFHKFAAALKQAEQDSARSPSTAADHKSVPPSSAMDVKGMPSPATSPHFGLNASLAHALRNCLPYEKSLISTAEDLFDERSIHQAHQAFCAIPEKECQDIQPPALREAVLKLKRELQNAAEIAPNRELVRNKILDCASKSSDPGYIEHRVSIHANLLASYENLSAAELAKLPREKFQQLLASYFLLVSNGKAPESSNPTFLDSVNTMMLRLVSAVQLRFAEADAANDRNALFNHLIAMHMANQRQPNYVWTEQGTFYIANQGEWRICLTSGEIYHHNALMTILPPNVIKHPDLCQLIGTNRVSARLQYVQHEISGEACRQYVVAQPFDPLMARERTEYVIIEKSKGALDIYKRTLSRAAINAGWEIKKTEQRIFLGNASIYSEVLVESVEERSKHDLLPAPVTRHFAWVDMQEGNQFKVCDVAGRTLYAGTLRGSQIYRMRNVEHTDLGEGNYVLHPWHLPTSLHYLLRLAPTDQIEVLGTASGQPRRIILHNFGQTLNLDAQGNVYTASDRDFRLSAIQMLDVRGFDARYQNFLALEHQEDPTHRAVLLPALLPVQQNEQSQNQGKQALDFTMNLAEEAMSGKITSEEALTRLKEKFMEAPLYSRIWTIASTLVIHYFRSMLWAIFPEKPASKPDATYTGLQYNAQAELLFFKIDPKDRRFLPQTTDGALYLAHLFQMMGKFDEALHYLNQAHTREALSTQSKAFLNAIEQWNDETANGQAFKLHARLLYYKNQLELLGENSKTRDPQFRDFRAFTTLMQLQQAYTQYNASIARVSPALHLNTTSQSVYLDVCAKLTAHMQKLQADNKLATPTAVALPTQHPTQVLPPHIDSDAKPNQQLVEKFAFTLNRIHELQQTFATRLGLGDDAWLLHADRDFIHHFASYYETIRTAPLESTAFKDLEKKLRLAGDQARDVRMARWYLHIALQQRLAQHPLKPLPPLVTDFQFDATQESRDIIAMPPNSGRWMQWTVSSINKAYQSGMKGLYLLKNFTWDQLLYVVNMGPLKNQHQGVNCTVLGGWLEELDRWAIANRQHIAKPHPIQIALQQQKTSQPLPAEQRAALALWEEFKTKPIPANIPILGDQSLDGAVKLFFPENGIFDLQQLVREAFSRGPEASSHIMQHVRSRIGGASGSNAFGRIALLIPGVRANMDAFEQLLNKLYEEADQILLSLEHRPRDEQRKEALLQLPRIFLKLLDEREGSPLLLNLLQKLNQDPAILRTKLRQTLDAAPEAAAEILNKNVFASLAVQFIGVPLIDGLLIALETNSPTGVRRKLKATLDENIARLKIETSRLKAAQAAIDAWIRSYDLLPTLKANWKTIFGSPEARGKFTSDQYRGLHAHLIAQCLQCTAIHDLHLDATASQQLKAFFEGSAKFPPKALFSNPSALRLVSFFRAQFIERLPAYLVATATQDLSGVKEYIFSESFRREHTVQQAVAQSSIATPIQVDQTFDAIQKGWETRGLVPAKNNAKNHRVAYLKSQRQDTLTSIQQTNQTAQTATVLKNIPHPKSASDARRALTEAVKLEKALKEQWQAADVEATAARTRILTLVNDPGESTLIDSYRNLHKLVKKHEEIFFPEILRLWLQGRLYELRNRNPNLTAGQLNEIDEKVTAFLDNSNKVAIIKKGQAAAHTIAQQATALAHLTVDSPEWKEKVSALEHARQNLSATLQMHRVFKLEMSKLWIRGCLMIEYLKGYRLRQEQIDVFHALAKDPTCAKQLIMGAGKTDVGTIIIMLMLARGDNHAMWAGPRALFNTNSAYLEQIFRTLGVNPYRFDFERNMPMNGVTLQTIYHEQLRMCTELGFTKTTPQSMQCFELRWLKQIDMYDESLSPQQKREMAEQDYWQTETLKLWEEASDVLVDEIDSQNDPFQQYLFESGTPELLERQKPKYEVPLELIGHAISNPVWRQRLKLRQNLQNNLSQEDFTGPKEQAALPAWQAQFRAQMIQEFLDRWTIEKADHTQVTQYLMGQSSALPLALSETARAEAPAIRDALKEPEPLQRHLARQFVKQLAGASQKVQKDGKNTPESPFQDLTGQPVLGDRDVEQVIDYVCGRLNGLEPPKCLEAPTTTEILTYWVDSLRKAVKDSKITSEQANQELGLLSALRPSQPPVTLDKITAQEIAAFAHFCNANPQAAEVMHLQDFLEDTVLQDMPTGSALWKYAAVAKETLSTVLYSCLKKKGNVSYGFEMHAVEENGTKKLRRGEWIVPYYSCMKPRPNSVHGHVLERVLFHIFSYIQNLISKDQIRARIEKLKQEVDFENESHEPNSSPAEQEWTRLGWSKKPLLQITEREIDAIYNHLNGINENGEPSERSILNFLRHYLLPQMKLGTETLESNSQNFASMVRNMCGFSGTVGLVKALADKVQMKKETASAGTNGKTIEVLLRRATSNLQNSRILGDTEVYTFKIDEAASATDSQSAQLLQFFQKMVAPNGLPAPNFAVDAGAYFSGTTPKEVALGYLDHFRNPANRGSKQHKMPTTAIFMENGQWRFIRSGETNSSAIENIGNTPLEERITIYSQSECVGAHLPQHPSARFVLTGDASVTLEFSLQAAARARGLWNEQQLPVHWVPDATRRLIKGKDSNEPLKFFELLGHYILNQADYEARANYKATRQKILNITRQALIKLLKQAPDLQTRKKLLSIYKPVLFRMLRDDYRQMAAPTLFAHPHQVLKSLIASQERVVQGLITALAASKEINGPLQEAQTKMLQATAQEVAAYQSKLLDESSYEPEVSTKKTDQEQQEAEVEVEEEQEQEQEQEVEQIKERRIAERKFTWEDWKERFGSQGVDTKGLSTFEGEIMKNPAHSAYEGIFTPINKADHLLCSPNFYRDGIQALSIYSKPLSDLLCLYDRSTGNFEVIICDAKDKDLVIEEALTHFYRGDLEIFHYNLISRTVQNKGRLKHLSIESHQTVRERFLQLILPLQFARGENRYPKEEVPILENWLSSMSYLRAHKLRRYIEKQTSRGLKPTYSGTPLQGIMSRLQNRQRSVLTTGVAHPPPKAPTGKLQLKASLSPQAAVRQLGTPLRTDTK